MLTKWNSDHWHHQWDNIQNIISFSRIFYYYYQIESKWTQYNDVHIIPFHASRMVNIWTQQSITKQNFIFKELKATELKEIPTEFTWNHRLLRNQPNMKTIHQISTEEDRAKKNSGKVRNKTLFSSRMKHPWSRTKCSYHTGRK